jgi:hypothetical protein
LTLPYAARELASSEDGLIESRVFPGLRFDAGALLRSDLAAAHELSPKTRAAAASPRRQTNGRLKENGASATFCRPLYTTE